ncbi:MAG: cardiolipin synthase [Planctomycetota bacterium]
MEAALYAAIPVVAHVGTCAGIGVRVIMRKPAVGVALAWLFLVFSVPFLGALFYLLIGERRVGQRRAEKIARLHTDYAVLADRIVDDAIVNVDWTHHPPAARGMDRLGAELVGVPTVAGSTGELLTDSEEILLRLAEDIDEAETSVFMEFYIWSEGGLADKVLESLARAAERGVSCRLLVDAIGGRPWWRGKQPERLRRAGVRVLPAFPTGVVQAFFSRNDLRLHRKIVVLDGEIGWTGSMNLVDPRYFKQDANVGEWVDAMVRLEGAVVAPLAMTIIGDWLIESEETVEDVLRSDPLGKIEPKGAGDVQVIPSGPVETCDALLQMLLALVNAAQRELVLTTPYFVPDESLLRAIRGAAGRGVETHLVLPERIDSLLTRYACRSYLEELMSVGVNVHLFTEGLLHTKSVTVDEHISMFGTVNLDMRSLWLNYEVSLFVYSEPFGKHLRGLQQTYIEQSRKLSLAEWRKRPYGERVAENTLRLFSPVL